jgi:hypothetical protein
MFKENHKKLLRRLKRAYKCAMVGLEDIKGLKYFSLSIMDWSDKHITVYIKLFFEDTEEYKKYTYYDEKQA